MISVFLLFWIASAFMIVCERSVIRIIIYSGIYSLISAACFLVLAAPDVAMAEAVISAFSTIFYIICLEKYYGLGADANDMLRSRNGNGDAGGRVDVLKNILLPAGFTLLLFALFVYFVPDASVTPLLKNQYIAQFVQDVGGENTVTAIYLGYRVYDTLFEALMLLVSVVAVAHLSWYSDVEASDGSRSLINRSEIAVPTIRIVVPVLILFGIYLIMNGHLSPGGGFQGGVVVAAFYICRYMIYDIYDVKIGRFMTVEKCIFIGIVTVATVMVFLGIKIQTGFPREIYLIVMNALIGFKVACGFTMIFYRYIVFERK